LRTPNSESAPVIHRPSDRHRHPAPSIHPTVLARIQPLGAFLGQHPVDAAARAAVGVGDENAGVGRPMLADHPAQALRDFRRAVVEFGRKAPHVQMAPAPAPPERVDLSRQRAAGNDQDRIRRGRPFWRAAPAGISANSDAAGHQ